MDFQKKDTDKEIPAHESIELKPFAAIALQSPSIADSNSVDNEDRHTYPYSIERAEIYLLEAGYIVAPRTLSNYCHTNQFQCKKFSSDGVRRWFIKESSIVRHLKRLKRDQPPNASERKPSHASNIHSKKTDTEPSNYPATANAGESNDHTATAMYNVKYVNFLEEQVSQKDSQLTSLLAQSDRVTKLTNGLGSLLVNRSEHTANDNEENYKN